MTGLTVLPNVDVCAFAWPCQPIMVMWKRLRSRESSPGSCALSVTAQFLNNLPGGAEPSGGYPVDRPLAPENQAGDKAKPACDENTADKGIFLHGDTILAYRGIITAVPMNNHRTYRMSSRIAGGAPRKVQHREHNRANRFQKAPVTTWPGCTHLTSRIRRRNSSGEISDPITVRSLRRRMALDSHTTVGAPVTP